METFLEGAVDLDEIVHRSVRLLSQLTQQVAVVQYPSLSRSAVRHLEIVHLAPNHLLLVLITELINSSIEAVTDRVSLEDHVLAKRAKDMASAAVMISLINVPVVWLLVLFS